MLEIQIDSQATHFPLFGAMCKKQWESHLSQQSNFHSAQNIQDQTSIVASKVPSSVLDSPNGLLPQKQFVIRDLLLLATRREFGNPLDTRRIRSKILSNCSELARHIGQYIRAAFSDDHIIFNAHAIAIWQINPWLNREC